MQPSKVLGSGIALQECALFGTAICARGRCEMRAMFSTHTKAG